jgi:HSP20 family protein
MNENQNQEPFEPHVEMMDLGVPQETEVELVKANTITPPRGKTVSLPEEDINEPEGQLTIDVYQTPGEIIVESAVAGVEPDNIDIHVTADSVTIRGSRKKEKQVREEDYLYQECYWGRFSRSIILPQEVDADRAVASFKNGILTVRLPKVSKQKVKKLRVQSG